MRIADTEVQLSQAKHTLASLGSPTSAAQAADQVDQLEVQLHELRTHRRRLLGLDPTTPGPAARQTRMLIVEDDEDTAEALRQLLMMFGYRAVAVGPEAAEAATDQFSPDGVLLHLGHPNNPWLSLVGRLRAGKPDLTVIGVTGWGAEEFRAEAERFQLNAVLTKPIGMHELLRALPLAAAA